MAGTIAVRRDALQVGHGLLLLIAVLLVNGCCTKTRTVVQTIPVTTSCLPPSAQVPERPAITHGCPTLDPELRHALELTDRGRAFLQALDGTELCFDNVNALRLAHYRDLLERTLRTWRTVYCPLPSPEETP